MTNYQCFTKFLPDEGQVGTKEWWMATINLIWKDEVSKSIFKEKVGLFAS